MNVTEAATFSPHLRRIDGNDFGGRNFSFQAQYGARFSWVHNGTTFAERNTTVNGSKKEYFSQFSSSERSYDQESWRNATHLIIRNTPTSDEYPLESEWTGLLLGNNVTAEDSTFSHRLYEVATELEFQVVQRGYTPAGEPRIVLEHKSQRDLNSAALRELIGPHPIEQAHVRIGMRPDGLITNATWSFRGDVQGEPAFLNASWTFEYGQSGTVRPDWLSGAIIQEVKIEKVNDKTYKVTNVGSLPYPAGSKVFFAFPFGTDAVELEKSLDPGESIYTIFSGTQFSKVDEPASDPGYADLPDQVQVVIKVDRMRLVSDSSSVD